MALLCDLGMHRAGAWPRWNHGYYFTKCERCGLDLVRTAYGGWQVPRGFRVRWQATPPEKAHLHSGPPPGEDAAAEEQVAGREPPAEPAEEAVKQEPPAAPAPEEPGKVEPPPPPPPAPAPRPPSRIPDFMAEEGEQGPPRADALPAPPPLPALRSRGGEEEEEAPRRPLLPMLMRPAQTTGTTGEGGGWHAAPVIGFFLFMILLALALALVRWPSSRGGAPAPATADSAAQPAPAPLPQAAFRVAVEASLLNCRATPSPGAEVLQRLGYGETAQLIERGAEWAAIDTGRHQCWVLEQYLSAPIDL